MGDDNPTNRGVFRDFRNNNINTTTTNRIPFYPTATRPAAAPANKGQIIFDTTTNEFCYNSGTAWVCLASGTANSVGIVDCTVGNSLNANAQHNSVQAALDAGCRNIRIIDGLTGGQVSGYTESMFVLGTTPTMIYIDPGVDWVFNLTVLGDVPITATGSKLTVRGSGWESIMRVSQTGTTFELMDTDTSTNLQFLDIRLETNDNMSFPNQKPWSLLFMSNCEIVGTDNTGNESLFNLATTVVRTEFNQCTFIGGGTSMTFIQGSGNILQISDCQMAGSWSATPTSFDGITSAVEGSVHVNGFIVRTITDSDITIGGGSIGNVQFLNVKRAFGTGILNITTANGAIIQNCIFDTLVSEGSDCLIENCHLDGLAFIIASDNILNNNYIDGVGGLGNNLNTADRCIMNGNRFRGAMTIGTIFIPAPLCPDVILTGNIFHGTFTIIEEGGGGAIAKRAVITGNQFLGGAPSVKGGTTTAPDSPLFVGNGGSSIPAAGPATANPNSTGNSG